MVNRWSAGADESGVVVRLYYPNLAIQSFVTFYYFVECAGPLEDFLYPEWGNVRFAVRGEWWAQCAGEPWREPMRQVLFGPTDRAAMIRSGGGLMVGLGLTPLGWERLFDEPADALANDAIALDARLGLAGEAIIACLAAGSDSDAVALFDRLLGDRFAARPGNSALATATDRVLRERPRDVETFAREVGVSARTLGRVCHRLFGFSPKRLLRRQRFLDTLGQIRITENPEIGTMIDAEYFDQSHFNREFREFMGVSPSAYLAAPRPLMRKAAEAQQAIGIPLSFKLPPQPETVVSDTIAATS